LLFWASAWTNWIFTAKSVNPVNQEDKDKKEAAINIKLARPYVMNSIQDAMKIGEEIGRREQISYRPSPDKFPEFLYLRKG
jgi:hypothetical protein